MGEISGWEKEAIASRAAHDERSRAQSQTGEEQDCADDVDARTRLIAENDAEKVPPLVAAELDRLRVWRKEVVEAWHCSITPTGTGKSEADADKRLQDLLLAGLREVDSTTTPVVD